MAKRSQSPRNLRESARAMSTPSPRSRSNSTQRRNEHGKRRTSSPEPRHGSRRSSLRRHISPKRTTTPRRLSLYRKEKSPSPRPSPSIEELKNIKIEIKNTALGGESRILIRRRSDEGKRNIFDRDEIKFHQITHDEAIGDKYNNSGDGEISGRRSSDRRRSRSPKLRWRIVDRRSSERRRSRSPKLRWRIVDRPRETIESRSHRSPERRRGPTYERRRSPSRGDNCPPPLKGASPFFPRVCPMVRVEYVPVPVMHHPRPFLPLSPIRPAFMGAPPRPMGPRPRPPFMPPSGPRYFP